MFVFEPMFHQASLDWSEIQSYSTGDTVHKPVFSGGKGTKGGLEDAATQLEHSGVSTQENIILVILGWVNFSLPFAGLFAFVGIVYAGFLYVLNFANEEMANKAKTIIFLSLIGLIIIFSAYAIVSTVISASTA